MPRRVDSSTAPELRAKLHVGLDQWLARDPYFPLEDVITDVVGVIIEHFSFPED